MPFQHAGLFYYLIQPLEIHTASSYSQYVFNFCHMYVGMNSPEFDNQTLAALRGRMVRYLMRSREVSLTLFFSLCYYVVVSLFFEFIFY